MDSAQHVPCKHCLEPIAAGAKRCPHCLSWQSKWAADPHSPKTMLIGFAALGIMVLPLVALIMWQEARQKPQPRPTTVLSIAAPELIATPDSGQVALLAGVTNTSDLAWRDLYIQVVFRGSSGVVTDAFVDRDYDLVVPPQSTIQTRIARRTIRPLSDYQQPEVRILTALPFKDF